MDALAEYRTEPIPGTNRPVVNPLWRELDRQHRSLKSKLTQRQARFAALALHPEAEDSETQKWEQQKAELQEEIEQLENDSALGEEGDSLGLGSGADQGPWSSAASASTVIRKRWPTPRRRSSRATG